ncbi:MAG TPA: hypothetical protein VM450_01090 [Thermomicrobiales bacterium]|nr:hypothetical protein [Thermomicrobiales bacterium]
MNQVLRLTGLLVLVTLLAGWQSPALAQEASPAGGGEVTILAGMREAIGRQYAVDVDAPSASPAVGTPESAAVPDIFFVTARIVAFDTDDHAATAYEQSIAGAMSEVEALGVTEAQVTADDIPGLGDQAHAVTMHSTRDGVDGYLRLLFVRDQGMLYIISVIASTEQGAGLAGKIATAMLAREASDEKATFNADGTSTGGLWAIFPAADDPALRGLIVLGDQQLAPPRD